MRIVRLRFSSAREETMKRENKFPPGWDEQHVRELVDRYESQSQDEAVAEDEAAFEGSETTMIEIPNRLVAAVRELLTKR